MTPEQSRAVQDAMTALAKMPGYSGAAVVLFTNNFGLASTHQHGVKDDLMDQALEAFVRQRALARSPIIVPGRDL